MTTLKNETASIRLIALVALACFSVIGILRGAPDEEAVAKAGLKLELVLPKKEYQVGEPIDVKMRYTCTAKVPKWSVQVVTYDRGGRIIAFGFTGKTDGGVPVRDPLKYLLLSMGGIRPRAELSPEKPYEQTVQVNEWLAFDQPGKYRFEASSEIVSPAQPGEGYARPLRLESAPVEIQIIAPDREWRAQTLEKIKADFKGTKNEASAAMQRLRYLLDPEVLPLLLKGLDQEETRFQAFCGLACLPDTAGMKAAVLAHLDGRSMPSVESNWSYVSLLAHADMTAEGLDPGSGDKEAQVKMRDIRARWQDYVTKKSMAEMEKLPAPAMAAQLVDAIAIGGLDEPTIEQRRILLQNVATLQDIQIMRAPYAIHRTCREPALKPELLATGKDLNLEPRIRSSALVVLHLLGDDELRDSIVADLISISPKLQRSAWATLGNYRKDVIANALLKNAVHETFEVRLKSAELIRDFGEGVTAEQLNRLIDALAAQDRFNSPELIEALAARSPDDTLRLLGRILSSEIKSENDLRPIALKLLARMPNGADQVRKELSARDARRRVQMVQELQQAAYDTSRREPGDFSPSDTYEKRMPGDRKTIATYAPDLLKLAENDSSDEVRFASAGVLATISGVPAQADGPVSFERIGRYIPEWRKWAKERVGK